MLTYAGSCRPRSDVGAADSAAAAAGAPVASHPLPDFTMEMWVQRTADIFNSRETLLSLDSEVKKKKSEVKRGRERDSEVRSYADTSANVC
jgi:hypothetical protein